MLGTTGVTAYVGIHNIGQVQAGKTVLVRAATGAVGGVAVQLAKAAGARVVAIAGGKDRTDHAVQVLGVDVAVDYRDPAFPQRLQRAAGEGVDVFFDNVGGRQLTRPYISTSIFQMRARSTMALPQPSRVTAESAQLLMHYRERGRYRALIESQSILWYADWLINLSELPTLLKVKPVRSELVYLLVGFDKQYTADSPAEPWESYYASRLLDHFRPATS
ncbi:MAG: zinc-binding dehydrogenase [Actinobacteria bacterium]|nr:zinc-binding dehydrogenase [Actinomycetota bacterium]